MLSKKLRDTKVVWMLVLLAMVLFVVIFSVRMYIKSIDPVPAEVLKYGNDWPLPNKDFNNTRTTLASGINSSNVSSLGVAWSFPIAGVSEWGAAATNPLILGNTIYFEDLKSNVYSVNLTTGKQNWVKTYNQDNAGPNGPSIANGKLFVAKGNYEVAALDLEGRQLWAKKISDNPNVGVDTQTLAYGDTVYVCTVPGVSNSNFYKGGGVGKIYALDAASGNTKWSFNTIDSADIWGNAKENSGGGCWNTPAIDTMTNKTYWGIANPAPWPGTVSYPNGSSRPGNNLYTNSLLSLDHKTGKVAWYTQVLPHDLFDYDLQISPILANLDVNGKNQDIVIGAGKMGKVFAFNRASGEKLWEVKVGTHKNDELKELPKGETEVSPGPLGGVETNMAYSDGVVYAPVVNMTVKYTPAGFVATSFNLGAGTGEVNAIDASNGKILWTTKLDSIDVGGATVVNDLVFTSTFNGKIYALNKDSGAIVWQYQAPAGINGWPAVSGDTIIFPAGVGKSPALLGFKVNGSTTVEQGGSAPESGSGDSKNFEQ